MQCLNVCLLQKVINETTCHAFMSVMTAKISEKAAIEEKSRGEIETVQRELAELKHALKTKDDAVSVVYVQRLVCSFSCRFLHVMMVAARTDR